MPSRFEPCGLNQMYSLRYGTPPIVRATGGLADTVIDVSTRPRWPTRPPTVSSSKKPPRTPLAGARTRHQTWHDQTLWQRIQQNGMRRDFSWEHAADEYAALYRDAIAAHH
jgi:starch synthase